MWFILVIHFASSFVQHFYNYIVFNYDQINLEIEIKDDYKTYYFYQDSVLHYKVITHIYDKNIVFIHEHSFERVYTLDRKIILALLTHFEKNCNNDNNPYRRRTKTKSKATL